MILGVVRSPLTYFDITPSGELTNRFSNDLGILDNQIAGTFVDIVYRLTLWIVMVGNIIEL